MVRRIRQAWQAMFSNLFASWHVEDGVNLQLVRAVEDIIQGLDMLAVFSEFPSGVFRLVAEYILVCRVEPEKM